MLPKLLLIFIGVPFIEMLVLIKLGELLGFWNTVLLVVLTGLLGAIAARLEGMRAWLNIQAELREGRMPASRMLDGLLIFFAGVVLITPGLLTDVLGFLVLIPWTRRLFKEWLRRKFEHNLRPGGGSWEYPG